MFKAFDYSVNDSGSWKAICNEYVFNPIEVEEGGTIGKIANDAKGLNRGKPSTINGIQPQISEVNNENENLPKATDKIPQNISVDKNGNWVSTNGWGADYVSENKQYNTNRNMKQTIKVRESELRNMIVESIRGTLKEGRKDITPAHEFRLRKYVGELAKQVKKIWEKCTMYEQGMNNYLADLVENEPWVDKLWDVANEMEEYAEAIDKKPYNGAYEGEPYHFGY